MPPRTTSQPADPLAAMVDEVNRQYGSGSLMEMGQSPPGPVEVIRSGSIGLDDALGIGGLPRGRVIEIFGPEMSGKTTLALHAIANAQKAGGVAVMIDAEHALDPDYAASLGVDIPKLLLSQPDTGEEGLEIADIAIRSGVVSIVVIDSVAALVPKAEIEGMMGDSHIGLQARLMSQALRKITGSLSKTGTTCIFINQLREKVGIVFGNPEVTSGGKALKFYASVRLDVRRAESIKEGTDTVGHRLRIKVVKNKLAPPFREYTADLVYGRGISREAEIIDLGATHGVLHKSGSHYRLGDQAVNGKEAARRCLEENPALADELEQAVRGKLAECATRGPLARQGAPAPPAVSLIPIGPFPAGN